MKCNKDWVLHGDICIRPHPHPEAPKWFECTCSHGTALVGPDCPKNGWKACTACEAGYTLAQETIIAGAHSVCKANECTCEHGFPAISNACVVDGEAICGMCDPGYHLLDGACVPNECFCEHGTATAGRHCSQHASSTCDSCDEFYHIQERTCAPNVCWCHNGQELGSGTCPEHQHQYCAECDKGYRLEGRFCVRNHCRCDNGKAVEVCKEDGATICQAGSCSPGYHHDDSDGCAENLCRCKNGIHARGSMCHDHGALGCMDCHFGYHMEETQGKGRAKECLPNKCDCKDEDGEVVGTGALGRECAHHNAPVCIDCKIGGEGYFLKQGLCVKACGVCKDIDPMVAWNGDEK